MTPKLPSVTAKQLVRVAEDWAFPSAAKLGAMQFMCERNDQARVVIPMHGGDLKRKTLRGIVQDMRIAVEEFAKLL